MLWDGSACFKKQNKMPLGSFWQNQEKWQAWRRSKEETSHCLGCLRADEALFTAGRKLIRKEHKDLLHWINVGRDRKETSPWGSNECWWLQGEPQDLTPSATTPCLPCFSTLLTWGPFLQKVPGIFQTFVVSGNTSRASCLEISPYLQGFVEPSVAAVEAAAATVQHLRSHTALVDVLGHPGHGGIQAHGADALLDGTHRFLVGLIWERNEPWVRGSCVTGRRLKFVRVGLKGAVLGSHCTSVGVYTAVKIAASWVVTGVNMLHSPSFFHFSYHPTPWQGSKLWGFTKLHT